MGRGKLAVLFVLGMLGLGAQPATAASTVGSFEIEGNRADDSGPGEPIDWDTPPPNLTTFTDATGKGDDSFKQGSKEEEPGGWVCSRLRVPRKDDILSGDIALRRHDGKQFAYIDFRRLAPEGDAHMDYEFNQSTEPNPACPDLPKRTNGDLAITFDTELGGAQIIVRLFRWQGDHVTGNFVEEPLGTRGATWDGAVNIPNTIPGYEAGTYGEAAINLTDTIGDIACGQFATAHMKTRASTSISSEVKDRTAARQLQGLCPRLDLTKAADKTELGEGDEVTYTLSYSNSGEADATGVVITDDLPAGTEFVSCSNGCTQSGSTVSWSIGSVPAGGSGSVTLTVRVANDDRCDICNVATIDSDQTAPSSSNEVCASVIPEADPAGANSHDSAYGAKVQALGLVDQTLVPVQSSQSGVGSSSDSGQLLDVDVPADGSLLQADVMRTSSTSTVTESPPRSSHTSIAETANLNLLGGVVKASKVRAVANTTATPADASFSSLGSTFKDLEVSGVARNDVTPDTKIKLPASQFGPGSYVVLFEREGSTSGPAAGQTAGGTYAADLDVTMVRLHVTDANSLLPGDQTVDIRVANAKAHSDFPQITVCAAQNEQAVSGHAFIASATTEPELFPVRVGYVDIPSTGGHDHQDLSEAKLPADGSLVAAGTSVSDSNGTLSPSDSTASSYAQAEGVCVAGGASCTIAADVVRAESNSTASGSGASSNDGDTKLLGATVLGQSHAAEPAPNEVIELPGIGFVILNEQFCDNGAALPACSDGTGHAGLTVRAIHVIVTAPANPSGLAPGAEVIVAEAHSDATFR
jgi:uncharacterized repeat protein (TIGR01451 family)